MVYEVKIGRFELRRKIGRGGIGDVNLAYDPLNNREVALKLIDVGISDREMLEAEKQGAEIQRQLSHSVPQIARVYEIGEEGEHFYIAMEYVQGTDLSELLLRGPLAGSRALSFAIQLCEILEACSRVSLSGDGRRERVIHGDIKPQNVRIEERDRVRLLDFGVAKSVSLTRQYTGNVFGSLPYLSPERVTERKVSIQSDIWSVGVVLYQMLTGELPYQGESDEELKRQILQGGLPQPLSPRLPPALQPVLSRCLEVNPGRRFTAAADLRAQLETFLQSGASQGNDRSETRRTVDPLYRVQEGVSAETADRAFADMIAGSAGAPIKQRKRPLWARLSPDAYSELRHFHDWLRHLRSSVPPRARRFRGVVANLEVEIEKILSSWRLWVRQDERERLRERTTLLGDIAEPLAAVIREAEQIDKEVRLLAPGIQTLTDLRTRGWLSSQCQDWSNKLRQIGVEVYRRTDLHGDQDLVKSVRERIRLYAQVLSRLDEAERILSILGSTAQTAPLAAHMPELNEQLREQGPSDDWLKQIQGLVQPLREAARQAKDPVQELGRLTPLLADLHSWSQELKALQPEVEQLDARHGALRPGTKITDVDALAHDIEALRQRFISQAGELRDHKVSALEDQVKILSSVCGALPALEERLRGLKRERLDEPQALPRWMSQLEQVHDLFRSVVKSRESDLEQGLARAVENLEQRLLMLRGQPLSDRTGQEAIGLGDEIRELGRPLGADQLLSKLRQCREMEGRIEQLRRRVTEDLQELYRQQQTLRELNDELQAHSRQIGVVLSDLSQRIDELDEGAKEPSLERARQLADSLSGDLESLQNQFEEQGRNLLGERLAEIRATGEALRRIGRDFPASSLPDLRDGARPQEIAQAVMTGMEQAGHAREAAEQVFRVQEEYLQNARSILRLDNQEDLGPDEREAAVTLLAQIEQDLAESETNLVGRLELRARLIEDCGPLLRHFHSYERTALERREALRARLQRQAAQDLRRFCPELADRVAGLIYGLPAKPRDWKAVQTQLVEAERLLARLESQSARLASEELSRAARDLREGGGARREVDAILAELDRHPREMLPPWPLRQKLLEAYERQAGGGRE